MGRRAREEDATVSLFPFLSILACVIGVLTLMITAMALGQIDPKALEEAEEQLAEAEVRAAEHVRVAASIAAASAEQSELAKLVAEAEAIRQELERARAELKLLEQTAGAMATDDASAKLLAEMNRQRDRIAEMEKQLPMLAAEIEKLKAELAKRSEPPPPAQVRIQPGGSGDDIHPHFIECARDDVVILDGSNTRVRRGDLATSEPFAKAMQRVRDDAKGVMIFLVRPDGVWTYNAASDTARVHQTRNGKLPITGQGEIDLSLFNSRKR